MVIPPSIFFSRPTAGDASSGQCQCLPTPAASHNSIRSVTSPSNVKAGELFGSAPVTMRRRHKRALAAPPDQIARPQIWHKLA